MNPAAWKASAGNAHLRLLIAAVTALLVVVLLLGGCADADPITGSLTTSSAGQAAASTSSTTQIAEASVQAASKSILGESPAEAVAAAVSPSVVNVRVSGVARSQFFGDQPYEGVGSGVVLSADGYIITNQHVITENGYVSDSIEVTLSTGEMVTATVVGEDEFSDIAVIKVNKTGLTPATFAPSSDTNIGEYAIAIGSPLDYANSVTLGIVSGLGRTIEGTSSTSLVDLVQVDAAISPGNSGGAVLDADGRVIGIAVAYMPPESTGAQNIGFAIPSDTAISVADQLIASGRVSHAYLGINYTTITNETVRRYGLTRTTGALVTQVGQGSPAAAAGMQAGDVLVSVGDTTIAQDGDVVMALRGAKVGETVPVVVDRDGQETTLQVTLGERPTAG